jgi:ribosomal protein L11 methylase PrmA
MSSQKFWPALDVLEPDDLLLVTLDEFAPTAMEERESVLRVFFAVHENRDAARARLSSEGRAAAAIDVDDEDWARRSQQNLRPVTVGRITIVPRPEDSRAHRQSSADRQSSAHRQSAVHRQSPVHPQSRGGLQTLTIVIEPSMGFGTGHHATTRLCLAALQRTALTGAVVLDAGTGCGILAIAAARLGATSVLGVDRDADAIHSANENLALNPDARGITFAVADLTDMSLPRADVITANLTGTLLSRVAGVLVDALTPGGALILSGILTDEEKAVRRAFPAADCRWRQREREWIGLILTPRSVL